MGAGGARPGAGRKPDPNSARAKARSAREAKALSAQLTDNGVKKPAAPDSWPFGTRPPGANPPAPAAPAVETPVAPMLEEGLTALEYFQRIYRNQVLDEKTRFQAAVQALPFEIAKPGVTGKKAGKDEAAKKAVSRFAPSAPPKLAAVAGRKV